MSEFDTEYTDNVICPYCGYEDRDSWEYGQDDFETKCSSCGKEMSVTRNISISYSSWKLESADE